VSAHLTYTFDTSDFRTKAVGTRHVMALGTKRAVQVAGEAAAVRARSEHPHKRRTGRLTSPAELKFELRQADDGGSWGYLVNYTPYGAYVEYGTKPHKIYPKAAHGLIGPVREGQTRRATGKGPHEHIVGRGIALRFRVGGVIVFAKYVDHPGTQPLPFMYPAALYAETVLARETELVTFEMVRKLWES
jgi:hypothetical protein